MRERPAIAAHFTRVPTATARALQPGGPDAYGMPPEQRLSDGDGVPCRHCLAMVPAGAPYLVLACRRFPAPQPYAETGPVFLWADPCQAPDPCHAPEPGAALPDMRDSPRYILRGYDAGDRIAYGTGRIVATDALADAATARLDRPGIACADVRSASNNCFQVAGVQG